jgi:DNA repair protein RadA/Sms
MKNAKRKYFCTTCHHQSNGWFGQCGQCGEWNTIEELITGTTKEDMSNQKRKVPLKIADIASLDHEKIRTGNNEFDHVFDEGVQAGGVYLLTGAPGLGKSTLLLDVLGKSQLIKGQKILYVSGEETVEQVGSRSKRLGVDNAELYFLEESEAKRVCTQIKQLKPTWVVIDSIQTMTSNSEKSGFGGISNLKESLLEIIDCVKDSSAICFIVGHVTKDGIAAGPKTLEHMVDVVSSIEGDSGSTLRYLSTSKNRYGRSGLIGIFQLGKNGLSPWKGVDKFKVGKCHIGESIGLTDIGNRSYLTNLESLVVKNVNGTPRRVISGIDLNRVLMLLAIIEKNLKINLSTFDVYLKVRDGIRLQSPGDDLSVVASLLSAYYEKAIPADLIFLGEVTLTGTIELNSTPNNYERMKEWRFATPRLKEGMKGVEFNKLTQVKELLLYEK